MALLQVGCVQDRSFNECMRQHAAQRGLRSACSAQHFTACSCCWQWSSGDLRLLNARMWPVCCLVAADLEPRLSGGQLGYARPRTQDSSFSLDGGGFDGDGQGPGAAGARDVWGLSGAP